MNADRRRRLSAVAEKATELRDILSAVKEEEEEARDNIPENLQESERYQAMDEACDIIDDAAVLCDELLEKLQEVEGVEVA